MIEFRKEEDGHFQYLSIYEPNNNKPIAKAKIRDDKDSYYIADLYVNVDHRGKGFATILMKRLLEMYSDKKLTLFACPQDADTGFFALIKNLMSGDMPKKRLVAFYKRFGFKVVCDMVGGVDMERLPQ